jgi:RIO kinase 1
MIISRGFSPRLFFYASPPAPAGQKPIIFVFDRHMTKINPKLKIDEDFDPVELYPGKAAPSRFRKAWRSDHAVSDEILRYTDHDGVMGQDAFSPTYQGARYEREWILTYLGNFYEQGLIVDVLQRVKGGKEANVYCCKGSPNSGMELLAAKVYRPRMLRNLRNDARYRQGRDYLNEFGKVIHDAGLLVAIRKGSSVGKETAHVSWLEHEYATLEALRKAGCNVPRPVAVGNNTILMEYIGDLSHSAPTLHELRLPAREARSLFERLMADLNRMLAVGKVHGDLSAYNVLYWEGEGRIIDLPQAVEPRRNPDAWDIFRRDIARLCQYFQRYGLGRDPDRLAGEMWSRYDYPRGPEAPLPEEEEEE